jgi:hypothetical protein
VEREVRAPQRRSPEPWTFGYVLTDWEDRHRDGVQESTMRDYGPALNDLRRALGGVLARSLTDEHFEPTSAKLDGIDVAGARSRSGGCPLRRATSAWISRAGSSARRSGAASRPVPIPSTRWYVPAIPTASRCFSLNPRCAG